MAKTRAQENKAIRQETLRDQLSNQKHIEKVIDNIKKIETLAGKFSGGGSKDKDDSKEIDYKELQAAQFETNALKMANEQRLKLVGKYLPDLKQQEITIEADIVAKEKTRKELEDKLLEAGIDLDAI
jgi:hypothetical protein